MESVAVAFTVKNEAGSIARLLDALWAQTVPPAEVLVADGGSQDATVEVIEGYRNRGYPMRVIHAPGACRGRGRNLAIAQATADRIALIDGGCVPDPTWLERLLAALETSPPRDAVFGVVRPVTDGLLTECMSTASFPAVRLPQGRRVMSHSVASLLLRRRVWEQLGGFVEGLRTGEDVIFMAQLRQRNVAVGIAPEAVVHWEIPRTIPLMMRRIARFSFYGLEAGLGHTWHYRAFLQYAVGLTLVVLGIVQSAWWLLLLAGLIVARIVRTVRCNEKIRRGAPAFSPARILVIGGLLLAMDAATLYGACHWLLSGCGVRRRAGEAMPA